MTVDHAARPGARRARRQLLVFLVAVVVALSGLTFGAGTARAAEVVAVPDANLRAVLNTAIGDATATTRTPGQTITTDEALAVTTILSADESGATPISSFQGLEAFTNVTSVVFVNAGSTATDLRPFAPLSKLTDLTLVFLPVTSLDGLGGKPVLSNLVVAVAPELIDISALSMAPALTSVTFDTADKLADLSALAASKTGLQSLQVMNARLQDIGFLTGFKRLATLNLNNNRIEDVSVFSTWDDSYGLNDAVGNSLDLSGNRIKDFSPVVAFRSLRTPRAAVPTVNVGDQQVYAGRLDEQNGVTVVLKSGPDSNNATTAPRVTNAALGSYTVATSRLTSTSPNAAFLVVTPSWTVHFAEDPDKLAALRINEIESNGDTARGDWVELYNPAATEVDLAGVVASDNDNTHRVLVPTGTKIPAHGYRAIRTDDTAVSGNFGLGSNDSARIFAPGTTNLATTTPIDSHSWGPHADTTFGRTAPGRGVWTTTLASTYEATNTFPEPEVIPTVAVTGSATSTTGSANLTATVTKPDSTDPATDATGHVVFAVDGSDRSGPVTVTGGTATWNATNLVGSAAGTAHQITARYVSAGDEDPYDDSALSAPFTVTVTIGEFTGAATLSATTAEMCQPVSVDLTGVSPSPDSVSYQWQTRGPISGEWGANGTTSATQTASYIYQTGANPGVARSNETSRAIVTVSKAGYATRQLTTEPVISEPASYLTTPSPVLSSGNPKVGETITATHGAWTSCIPDEFEWRSGYNYQWLRDGQPIAGATDAVAEVKKREGGGGPKQVSYTVTPADAGHVISLRVSAASNLLKAASATSTSTAQVAAGGFSASPAPTIDRTAPKVGETLTATTAAWSPVAGFDYQWLRDGQPITGASSASYPTVAADLGKPISVRVTGTADGYEAAQRTSTATANVAAGAFTASSAPVIGNASPKLGDTLTATTAAWAPVAALAHQWLRDGQPITGATSASYTTVVADVGKRISVRVTGTAAGYEAVERTSTATASVAAGAFTASPAPVIGNASPKVGETLTATLAAWSPTASLTWQWLRDDQPIAGATGSSYTTTTADLGRAISVRVTGTAGGHESVQRTSTATARVAKAAKAARTGVRVTAVKGRKLQLRVSLSGTSVRPTVRNVKVRLTGAVRKTVTVTVKNGTATLKLGAAARKRVKVQVTVPASTVSTATTVFTAPKAVKKATVTVKK
ncbi:lamin tail domain-containing protein [Nocardioides sp. W7]|uniref:lamin tail domain-containing protein n=1 Tax=Nocardioides sp. W7 TaxID=2931390 RepID=UPI001FD43F3A|nr:lamin tail domain-containing protein [Nocardioides sp. W7]